MEIQEYHVFHGTCFVENKIVNFVCSSNIHRGVFVLTDSDTGKPEQCSRISALPFGAEDEDSMCRNTWEINMN